jgi:hypothetical protein
MRKHITACLILVLLLVRGIPSWSQESTDAAGSDKPLRVEIPARSAEETYRIIPVDSSGVLLYFKSVETVHDTLTKWYFSLYDKNLRRLWIKSVPIRTGLEFRDYCRNRDNLVFIFIAGEKSKGITTNEVIVELDCGTGTFTVIGNILKEAITTVKCMVFRDNLFLAYNIKNKPAQFQIVDLKSGKISDHPVTPPEVLSGLTGFILDTVNNAVFATIRKVVSKSSTECSLLKLNMDGTVLSETSLTSATPGLDIRFPQLVLTDPGEILVLAMGAAVKSKSAGKNAGINGSSGFYSCRVRNGNQSEIRFKTFLELNSATRIIDGRDLQNYRKKAMKKTQSSSEYLPELNILPHSLVSYQDQIIFLGESYIPEYHSENMTEFDFYGRPYINTYNVFDGYRFISLVIAGFDRTGNLKWDNSMEIRGLITSELVPKSVAYFTPPGNIVLCYSSEGRIASKIINRNEVIEKLDFSTMDLSNPEDKMISDSKNNMLPWYGPYFLCYGYQEIKNINAADSKRVVYYFTKTRFE